jgi:putative phosphoesterase
MRIAVLSDIHGNKWALEMVLSDLQKRGADELINLGDSVYGPLEPEATTRLLRALDIPSTTIWGNEDRVLFERNAETTSHSSLEFTRSRLTTESLDWLSRFPRQATLDDIYLTHGIPGDDETYLMEKVGSRGAGTRHPKEIDSLLRNVKANLILCGHSHLARKLQITGGPLVVNPGSVGLPAYSDVLPHPHVMETGSPHARYALAEKTKVGWSIELVALDYAWESAARTAELNGRPDWAHALRTGHALKSS